MSTIDERIAAAEALAARLADACHAVADAHDGAADDPVGRRAFGAAKCAKDAMDALRGCRAALAEKRRPKGPMVTLVWYSLTGRIDGKTQVEVIRRTGSTVLVRMTYGGTEWYRLSDGEAHGQRNRCRIAPADMERIRAMPPGENEVSRALKKLEAQR